MLFEPTDLDVSIKPFQTKYWNAVKFITPNFEELKNIARFLKLDTPKSENKLNEVVEITQKLVNFIDNVIVTLGADGVVIARKGEANESFFASGKIGIRHYKVNRSKIVTSVNGAGDNLASGIVAAMLEGLSEEKCVSVGLEAAKTALSTSRSVADTLFGKDHQAWTNNAIYVTLA